jgi:Flp pilus assembly protein TadG
MMSMCSLYRFPGADEGATAVEAAFVILAFVLSIFGLVQFAEIFWTWNTMILALGEGGRYAMVYNPTNFPSGPPASTCSVASPTLANCTVARANVALATYPSLSVSVSCTAGCTGTPTTMTLQGTFTFDFLMPQLLPYAPITMTQQLTVPLS